MKNRNYVLFLLALVQFTHIVDSMLIMPLGDLFISTFDITAVEYSYLVSAYAFAAAISAIIGVFFLDIFDRKRALIFIYTGFIIGTFCCAFATSFYMLVGLRFLTGMFGGLIGALALSIISDLFLFKERGRAMGVLFAAFSAASALGIPIGLYLATVGDWSLPFLVVGALGGGILLVIIFVFPSLTGHLSEINQDRSPMTTLRAVSTDRNQMTALIAGFILVLGHFLIIPFISPYLINNVGLTQMEISYQFFFGGIATVVTGPLVGRLTDRFGVMKVMVTMMLLSFIPTMLITTMPQSTVAFAVFITTTFFITASGRMIPSNTLITAAAPVANRGSFMSFKSAFQQLAIALAAIISGRIIYIDEASSRYVNYEYVGMLSIVVCLFTIYAVGKIKVAKGN